MGKLRLVMNLNGVEVWSDKEGGVTVSNDSVTFDDGSYCNVRTNEIVNSGTGKIKIGSPSQTSAEPEIVMEPRIFNSSEIIIKNISADIEIEPHDKKTIDVTVSGRKKDCDTIGMKENGKLLLIDYQDAPPRIAIMQPSVKKNTGLRGHIDSIREFLNKPIITSRSIEFIRAPKVLVKIKVPKGTKITAGDIDGEIAIGDTEGSLDLKINDDDANIGKIKNALLTSAGNGNINVSRVDGTLIVNLDGYGDITIEDGSVKDLKVVSTDCGHFEFGGTSQNGDLTCNSSGNITVAKINGTLITELEGSGNVTIEDGTIIDLKISTNDEGDFEFRGKAQNAELESNANGLITIKEVNGDLKATIGDSGYADITVEQGNLKNLIAKVENDGNIRFDGKTENSDLSIEDGASGDIYVDFSLNRPYKDNDGYGKITVENWNK